MEYAINKRIELIMNHLGLSQRKFAEKLNTSSGRINNIILKKNKPDSEILARIASSLNDLNAQWLLTGEGEMLLNQSLVEKKSKNFLVPIAAQAGYVNEFTQDFTDQNLIPINIPGIEGEARTFEIAGGSMEPLLFQGDYVVCRRVEHESRLKFTEVYVIVSNSGITAKYVLNRNDGLLCIPWNKEEYQQEVIPREEVREVWQVIGKYTTNLDTSHYPGVYQKITTRIEEIEEILRNSKRINDNS